MILKREIKDLNARADHVLATKDEVKASIGQLKAWISKEYETKQGIDFKIKD